MVGPPLATWRALGISLAVAAVVGYGLQLRLQDPLSSPVIPAEDPYTHMALVREHLRDGTLDPLTQGGTIYPPGMHALLAATIAYTGVGLYDLARVGPAFFGALGLAGLALLLARFESGTAALAATVAFAIVPESIFRTTMLSPTALDLALLPFLGYAILRTLQGRLPWASATAALAAFMLLSHPWIFGILGIGGLVLILLTTLVPWPAKHGPLLSPWGLVAVVAIVGSGVGLSLSGCWGACGSGFRDVLGRPGAPDMLGPGTANLMSELAAVVLVLSLLPLLVKAVRPRAFEPLLPRQRPPPGLTPRLLVAMLLVGGVLVATVAATSAGMPPFVNLPRMVGWPILLLGGLGLAVLPFRPSPGGHLGGALALATYPFVVFNPFHSEFWSHRTAVYFAFGLCILAGVAVAAVLQAGIALAKRLPAAGTAAKGLAQPRRIAPIVAITGLLLLAGLSTAVVAATPPQYEGGWYRLYTVCEFEGLQSVAALAQATPGLLVITPDWQSKLVIGGLADDSTRLWYKPDFYTDATERQNVIQMLQQQGRPIVVVTDRLMATEHPEIDPSFLHDAPWTSYGTWCGAGAGNGTAGAPFVAAYTLAR